MQFLTSKLPSYLPLILLSLALVVGLIAARRIWEETHEDEESATEEELLSDFLSAHDAGALDADELRRVKDLLNRPKLTDGVPAPRPLRVVPEPTPAPDAPGHAEPPGDSDPDPSC